MGASSISAFGPLNGPIYVTFWSRLGLRTATRFDGEGASPKFTEIPAEAEITRQLDNESSQWEQRFNQD